MANLAQSKKRARQGEKHRAHNASLRSSLRTAMKKIMKAIAAGDKQTAADAYKNAVPAIDKMANKKLIPKNRAARYKSRLNKHVHALSS